MRSVRGHIVFRPCCRPLQSLDDFSRGLRRAGFRRRRLAGSATSGLLPCAPDVISPGQCHRARPTRCGFCTPCTPDARGKVRGVATATRVPAPAWSDAPGMRLGTKGNDRFPPGSWLCATWVLGQSSELPLFAVFASGSHRTASGLSLSGLGATTSSGSCAPPGSLLASRWASVLQPLGLLDRS